MSRRATNTIGVITIIFSSTLLFSPSCVSPRQTAYSAPFKAQLIDPAILNAIELPVLMDDKNRCPLRYLIGVMKKIVQVLCSLEFDFYPPNSEYRIERNLYKDCIPMKTQLYRYAMICAVMSVLACNGPSDREAITETAERSDYRRPFKVNATSQERFTLPGMQPASAASSASENSSPYHFTTPPGWVQVAPTQFRNPNFKIGATGAIDCYMTTLSGDGGGLVSNLNRWRSQLGLEAYTQEEIDVLTVVQIMGFPARIVQFIGTYKGMDGSDTPVENVHLVGVIVDAPDRLITIKMTGPEAEVLPELTNFATFIDSLHSGDGHDHGEPAPQVHSEDDGHNHTTAPPIGDDAKMPADHPPVGGTQSELPANHPTVGTSDNSAPIETPTSGGGYAWEVPEGWTASQSASSMRLITLNMNDGANETAECYIVILGGAAGGRLANYNRWLEQLDNKPIDQEKMEQLPTVTMFDQAVPILSCEGTYGGMGGQNNPGYRLLGTAVEHNGKSLFVKLVGPKAVVSANQKQFEAFCASLKEK